MTKLTNFKHLRQLLITILYYRHVILHRGRDERCRYSGCVTYGYRLFSGALARHSAVDLGSVVVRALVERCGIAAHEIDEVILGQVLTAGAGQNPARQAALKGGLPNTVSAITINDVCGSGLKALHLATQAIQCGEADVVIAGGQENMSRAPHVLTDSRTGAQLGNSQLLDSLVHDGLWDAFNDYHMGVTAENLAREYGISRELQDAYALSSQQKRVQRSTPGVFAMKLSRSVPSARTAKRSSSIPTSSRAPMPAQKGWQNSIRPLKRSVP